MASKKDNKESSESTGHVHGPHCNHGHGHGHDHVHDHGTQTPIVNEGPKIGRNDPCHCGSQKKYKKCCGKA